MLQIWKKKKIDLNLCTLDSEYRKGRRKERERVMGCNASTFIWYTWCVASACEYVWRHVHYASNTNPSLHTYIFQHQYNFKWIVKYVKFMNLPYNNEIYIDKKFIQISFINSMWIGRYVNKSYFNKVC